MSYIQEACALHERPFSDDKAEVQRGLRVIMDAATTLVAEAASQEPPISEDSIDMQVGLYAERRNGTTDSPPAGLQEITAGILELCKGSFEVYVAAPANVRHDDVSADLRSVRIPVGEYGEQDAIKLLTGTVKAVRVAEALYDEFGALATNGKNADLLRYHTYQGLTLKDPTAALVVTVQQGLIVSAGGAAILTAEKVPQFMDGVTLVRELENAESLTTLFARRVGSRVISTLAQYGCYPLPPLCVGDGGDATLSRATLHCADVTRVFSRQEAKQFRAALPGIAERLHIAHATGDMEEVLKLEQEYLLTHYQASLGTTCPGATRGGSVQQSIETILKLAS